MNRRQLIALAAALPVAAMPVAAQDDPNSLVTRWLDMLSTQDWSMADGILSEGYTPLYPTAKTLPGREAWKQRQATSTVYGMFQSVTFEPVSIAVAGEYAHVLAEMHGEKYNGDTAIVPLVGVFRIQDGLIVAGHGALDQDVLIDQL